MKTLLRPALSLFAFLCLVTGVLYPALLTGVAHALFPEAAQGSVIFKDGKPIGSALIGQDFADPKYFWGRPSATRPYPYNTAASGGANRGPGNPALVTAVRARVEVLRAADPGNARAVPIDLVTTSASGLDPHISPAAADYQVERVARERRMAPGQVREVVRRYTQARDLGLFGQARVNVLRLNLALDGFDTR